MPLPVCNNDPVGFEYEGQSDGAEAQVTKQEGSQRSTLGMQSLVLFTDPRAGFTLAYVWWQWWGLSKCQSSTGVLQGKKELYGW